MKAKIYTTCKNENKKLCFDGEIEFEVKNADVIEPFDKSEDVEFPIINIHENVSYHAFYGFGGAFTDASANAYFALSEKTRREFMDAYFDKQKGIGYTLGRISISSCDFSVDDYTYVKEGDDSLESFDISHDKEKIIPMIKDAQQKAELTLFASPWSPPRYMKTVNSIQGGHLKREYYPIFAKYVRKFADEYKKAGVKIWGVTAQNEPRHHQLWESCLYTPKEESDYIGALHKALDGSGVKIFCYDHCRERVFERAQYIFDGENGKYCDGIANHWYSGDFFEEIKAVRELYPDKIQIASEECCYSMEKGIKKEGIWEFGEAYAHDISGAISAGITHYCDWNITLNENNGPYHYRQNRYSVEAPIYCDGENDRIVIQPCYYYIGHYSKFIRPGAKCILNTKFTQKLDVCTFKNPDGSIVAVLLNAADEDAEAILRMGDNILKLSLPAHSIKTAVIEK